MKNNVKNQKYWEERIILKDKLLEKDINKIEKKLLKLFKDTRKEVLNELKIIYADIESTEYAKYRIDSLLMSIDNTLDNLYKKNEEQITEGLKEIYKRFDKEASIDLGASFNTINENLIREAIKTNWSGLSFSERIWEHRRRLAFTIKGELTKGLTRGDSLQDMSRIIADKLNNSYSNALRLVRTESCFIMNEATINNYKNNGIKKYEFMAFLDKKTSPQCRELDGKIISVEEYKAGLNFPPLHPNCRSCIVPVVEDTPLKENIEDIKNNTLSPIEELENKGVKVDIDSFKNVDKKLFEENAKQLNKLIDKYQIVKDYLEERSIEFCGKNIKGSAIAQVESNVFKERLLLSLNENFYKNYNEFIEMTTKNIKSGWSSKSKENYIPVRTLTHEFGHIVHECIIHNYNKANPNKLQKVWDSSMKGSLSAGKKKLKDYQLKIVREYNKEMIEIAKELEQGFSIEKSSSRYAKTDSFELFAECFAEFENGADTTISKAMKIMLEKRGIL